MRLLARGVAWLLIACTATWPAVRSIAERSTSTDPHGAIAACVAASPATAVVATPRSADRVGARKDRAPYSPDGLIVDGASASVLSAGNAFREVDSAASTSDRPGASRGRAPPLP